MKRILITGAGSFVGCAVQTHLAKWPEQSVVSVLDTENPHWRDTDSSPFDAIFHVAGREEH